ncbi:MAG TPA: gluconokinase, partial [Cytophagales bacterium]|nr:gluconokinase [Cytophagales bacterium]
MLIVVMGVSGCGKTSIGQLLASKLHLPFYDADDYHPSSNIDKMARGIPLDDQDRKPWLESLAELLKSQESVGTVLACSALKETYRKLLQSPLKTKIFWVLLHGPKDIIGQRLVHRTGHYMSSTLLDSQFETLEIPEYALKVSVEHTPEEIVQEIM